MGKPQVPPLRCAPVGMTRGERLFQREKRLNRNRRLERYRCLVDNEAHMSVTSSFSRRRFFGWTSSVAAALGASPLISSAGALVDDGEDYYDKLGVAKIINAAGTYTTLTAACMPPVVLAAVREGSAASGAAARSADPVR